MTTRKIAPSTQSRQGKRAPAKPATKRQQAQLPGQSEALEADEAPQGGFLDTTRMPREDIEGGNDWVADPIETLPELEREIGIADWIDPQTGEPAEGQSPPHLEEE